MMDIKYLSTLTKRNLVLKREKHCDFSTLGVCVEKKLNCCKFCNYIIVICTQLHIYGSREACTAILGPYENTKKMCKNKYVYNWL